MKNIKFIVSGFYVLISAGAFADNNTNFQVSCEKNQGTYQNFGNFDIADQRHGVDVCSFMTKAVAFSNGPLLHWPSKTFNSALIEQMQKVCKAPVVFSADSQVDDIDAFGSMNQGRFKVKSSFQIICPDIKSY